MTMTMTTVMMTMMTEIFPSPHMQADTDKAASACMAEEQDPSTDFLL